MAAERDLGGDKGFEIVAVVVGSAAAPFGVGGRRRVLCSAGGGLGGLLGKYIVETGVQGLFDLGAGAEVPVHPVFLRRLETLAGGTGDHAIGDHIVAISRSGIVVAGIFAAFGCGGLARDRRFGGMTGGVKRRFSLQ